MSPAVLMAGLGPLLLGIAVVQLPVGRGALLAALRSVGVVGDGATDFGSALSDRLAVAAPNLALGLVLATALSRAEALTAIPPWQAVLLSAPMSLPSVAWLLPVAALDDAGLQGPALWIAVFLGPWLGAVGLRRIGVQFGRPRARPRSRGPSC